MAQPKCFTKKFLHSPFSVNFSLSLSPSFHFPQIHQILSYIRGGASTPFLSPASSSPIAHPSTVISSGHRRCSCCSPTRGSLRALVGQQQRRRPLLLLSAVSLPLALETAEAAAAAVSLSLFDHGQDRGSSARGELLCSWSVAGQPQSHI